ncbi:lysis protein [Cupriavidus sp. H19C3]|uniref:hypothetical protein n=1 Tax=Cupriavidus sp. H19C3 TaxID=3241603 RepID=UPI003BF842B4
MNGLNRLEAIVLGVLALLAGAAIATPAALWYGGRHATAIADAKLASEREQLATSNAQALRHAGEVMAEETARGNRLSAQLGVAQDEISALARQLQEKVNDVSTVYRPAPGAVPQPLPVCIFTRGWLRQYNAAITGSDLPAATEGASAPAQASDARGAATGDDLAPVGIDQRSILSHHIDYGARARMLEEQLNRLIDYEEGKDAQ